MTTRGTGASNTIAFTEFTPLNGIPTLYWNGGIYNQLTIWQALVGNVFFNSPSYLELLDRGLPAVAEGAPHGVGATGFTMTLTTVEQTPKMFLRLTDTLTKH